MQSLATFGLTKDSIIQVIQISSYGRFAAAMDFTAYLTTETKNLVLDFARSRYEKEVKRKYK
jgi:hypothetical protein